MKTLVVLFGSLAIAVSATGLAMGSSGEQLSAKLTSRQEVPKPAGAAAAKGTFTGTLRGRMLTWKLTFSGLTGKARAAHVHLGKAGVAGAVLVPLCGPCRSGQRGSIRVSDRAEHAIEAGRTYVNVHTAKNQAGEIRGQIKVVDQ